MKINLNGVYCNSQNFIQIYLTFTNSMMIKYKSLMLNLAKNKDMKMFSNIMGEIVLFLGINYTLPMNVIWDFGLIFGIFLKLPRQRLER